MALGGFSLQLAEITATQLDAKGRWIASAQSRFDGSVITNISIEPSLHQQYVPTVGQQVILLRSDYFTVIFAYLGTRPFDTPLQPGEIKVEGSGGGFLYANQHGDIEITDAALSNIHQLINSVGWNFVGDAMSLVVKGIGQINIQDDQIEILKTVGTGDKSITTAKIVITATKIEVNAPSVELGAATMGGAVFSTSNVPGPYSFDWMGRPIPCSVTVKVTP